MEYKGTITEVSSMIRRDNRICFKVKASVEDAEALSNRRFMSRSMWFYSKKQRIAMTLPVDAVYYSAGDAYVYTYDGELFTVFL